MDGNGTIITLGREYGSGGRIIGRKVAEELGIPFYDREVIKLTAEESGLAEEVIKAAEQTRESSLIYAAYDVNCSTPLPERIFKIETKIIKEIASKGSCVIVGRCGDFVLKDDPDCIRVFIFAPFEDRLRRVKEEYGVNVKDVKGYIKKLDKDRAAYYDYFTTSKWGDSKHYHITLDSSVGIDACVKMIKAAYENHRQK